MSTEEKLIKGTLKQVEKQEEKGMAGKGLTVRAMEALQKGDYQALLEEAAIAFRLFRFDQ